MPLKQKLKRKLLFNLQTIQTDIFILAKKLPPSFIQLDLQKEESSSFALAVKEVIILIDIKSCPEKRNDTCTQLFKNIEQLFHQGDSAEENPNFHHPTLQLITLFLQVVIAVDTWQHINDNNPNHLFAKGREKAAEIFIQLSLDLLISYRKKLISHP